MYGFKSYQVNGAATYLLHNCLAIYSLFGTYRVCCGISKLLSKAMLILPLAGSTDFKHRTILTKLTISDIFRSICQH